MKVMHKRIMKQRQIVKPKSIALLITGTVAISLPVISLSLLAAIAVPIDLSNDFLQPVNEQYLKLKGQYGNIKHQIENQFNDLNTQNLGKDFNKGIQDVIQEAQTHVRGKIQSQIDKTTDGFTENLSQALQLPDIFKLDRQIEDIFSKKKTDILQLNPRVEAGNERQNLHRAFTSQQGESVLGTIGQVKAQQQAELVQKASDTSTSLAQTAQSDHITQDIIKKTATQNALILEVLKQTHEEAQEQNQLTATTNLNLNDIAQTLNHEQEKTQNQTLGAVNVLYTSAAFNNGLWSGSRANGRSNSDNSQ